MKNKQHILLHLLPSLLTVLFFIVHNWLDFSGMVQFEKLISSFIVWLLLPVSCFLLIMLLTKSAPKAGFATLLICVVYFFVPSLQQGITHYTSIKAIPVLLVLLVTALALLVFQLTRKTFNYKQLHRFSILCFSVLLAVEGIRFAAGATHQKQQLLAGTPTTEIAPPRIKQTGLQPDIYYFIFDLHASTASFKRIFEFDNSLLDSSLKQLGFTVCSNSTSASNYTLTSMAANFSMSQLPFDTTAKLSFRQMYQARESIRNNPLIPFLRQAGYEVVNASPFPIWKDDTTWLYHNGWGQPESLIRNQTLLPYLLDRFNWFFANYFPSLIQWKEKLIHHDDVTTIKAGLQRTNREIQRKQVLQPRFVYTHLFMPHEPFKFDSSGNQLQWNKSFHKQRKDDELFIQQLVYCRKLILSLAASIKRNNARPAVVIFQGDHGYRVPVQSPQKAEMVQILHAVYLPDGTDRQFSDHFYSPNTFRVVLNRYFGTNLPPLSEKHTLIQLDE